MLQRLCIVGLGLMGGAVGIAARKAGAASRIVGVADRPETIEMAKQIGAVDDATLDLTVAIADADLTILAVPVRLIPDVATMILQTAKDGALLTDLGSTKAKIVETVDHLITKLKSKVLFVGSHPITGSEKTGIESATDVKLEGATCILTPTPATDNDAFHRVEEFWKAIGMKTSRMAPEEHDAVLARSSHLPHLASFALIHAQNDRSLNMSGPGLRDMTRLAGSDVSLWSDIFTQNAAEVAKVTRAFGEDIMNLARELEILSRPGSQGSDAAQERLFRYMADAKQVREKRFPLKPLKSEQDSLRVLDTQIFPKP